MSITSSQVGVFTAEDLTAAISDGVIRLSADVGARQIQPASLDLTLGRQAWRIRSAFLPGRGRNIEDRLQDGLSLHQLDLSAGAVLEKGCVYLVRLRESIRLQPGMVARANPKSSTGRIDVFVRLVTDQGERYDCVPDEYKGPLYAEISPRTFSILVREGSSLNQLRIRQGVCALDDRALKARQVESPLVLRDKGQIEGGLRLSVDLSDDLGDVIGYRARRHAGLIDVDKVGALSLSDYWEPIAPPKEGFIILDPGEFYILASREELRMPNDLAAEMVPIDTELGAFRVHYAGFFDPGFGLESGSRAVLEVRGYDAPFLLDHGQVVARLTFEHLTAVPKTAYGTGLSSNYQGQRLRLSKHFNMG